MFFCKKNWSLRLGSCVNMFVLQIPPANRSMMKCDVWKCLGSGFTSDRALIGLEKHFRGVRELTKVFQTSSHILVTNFSKFNQT